MLLGLCGAHAAVTESCAEFLDQLLETNSARIQNDLTRRVGESRRTLESSIRARLSEGVAVAERSLGRARALQAEGSAAVARAVSELDKAAGRIRALAEGPEIGG